MTDKKTKQANDSGKNAGADSQAEKKVETREEVNPPSEKASEKAKKPDGNISAPAKTPAQRQAPANVKTENDANTSAQPKAAGEPKGEPKTSAESKTTPEPKRVDQPKEGTEIKSAVKDAPVKNAAVNPDSSTVKGEQAGSKTAKSADTTVTAGGAASNPPSPESPSAPGTAMSEEEDEYIISARRATIKAIKKLLEPKAISLSRDELARASRELKKVDPYNYDAWRLHADLLLTALRQLETRELQPDANFTILAVPLQEDDIRNAAEAALRQCAHFADSAEKRIALVDEANRVRRLTWT